MIVQIMRDTVYCGQLWSGRAMPASTCPHRRHPLIVGEVGNRHFGTTLTISCARSANSGAGSANSGAGSANSGAGSVNSGLCAMVLVGRHRAACGEVSVAVLWAVSAPRGAGSREQGVGSGEWGVEGWVGRGGAGHGAGGPEDILTRARLGTELIGYCCVTPGC